MSQLNINTIKNKAGTNGPEIVGHTTVTGDLTVTGSFIGVANTANIVSDTIINAGIVTSGGFSGNITGVAATFTGDVSIGGTLTYEDVTNVDSVGMITARKGIQVLADGINAVGVVTATSFAGPLTGNVTGNVAGNVTGDLIGGTIVGTSASVSGMTTTSNLVVENTVWTAITTTNTNKTIVNREYCTCVTSTASTNANITITLPASPQIGWEVGVAVAGTFLDTVVARNSSNIMALAEDMILNKEYIAVQLVYVNANVGWRFF